MSNTVDEIIKAPARETWQYGVKTAWYTLDQINAVLSAKNAEIEALKEANATALGLLAAWCCAIERNGTGWDYWDEYYKDAAYRPGPLREQLDAAIAAEKAECGMN